MLPVFFYFHELLSANQESENEESVRGEFLLDKQKHETEESVR
ncbi:hypothetical protein [Mesobacillus jeotgali]|nr:hypothetical protein [Mesobacillus jeotgali]UYZ21500.1 hypothetical protein FOF60_21215 [Mesobacillus jeotgali]